jgi:hypothetical protein
VREVRAPEVRRAPSPPRAAHVKNSRPSAIAAGRSRSRRTVAQRLARWWCAAVAKWMWVRPMRRSSPLACIAAQLRGWGGGPGAGDEGGRGGNAGKGRAGKGRARRCQRAPAAPARPAPRSAPPRAHPSSLVTCTAAGTRAASATGRSTGSGSTTEWPCVARMRGGTLRSSRSKRPWGRAGWGGVGCRGAARCVRVGGGGQGAGTGGCGMPGAAAARSGGGRAAAARRWPHLGVSGDDRAHVGLCRLCLEKAQHHRQRHPSARVHLCAAGGAAGAARRRRGGGGRGAASARAPHAPPARWARSMRSARAFSHHLAAGGGAGCGSFAWRWPFWPRRPSAGVAGRRSILCEGKRAKTRHAGFRRPSCGGAATAAPRARRAAACAAAVRVCQAAAPLQDPDTRAGRSAQGPASGRLELFTRVEQRPPRSGGGGGAKALGWGPRC